MMDCFCCSIASILTSKKLADLQAGCYHVFQEAFRKNTVDPVVLIERYSTRRGGVGDQRLQKIVKLRRPPMERPFI